MLLILNYWPDILLNSYNRCITAPIFNGYHPSAPNQDSLDPLLTVSSVSPAVTTQRISVSTTRDDDDDDDAADDGGGGGGGGSGALVMIITLSAANNIDELRKEITSRGRLPASFILCAMPTTSLQVLVINQSRQHLHLCSLIKIWLKCTANITHSGRQAKLQILVA